MKQRGIFCAYLYRAFHTPALYLSIAGTALVCCFCLMNGLFQDIFMLMNMLTDFTMFRRAIVVMSSLPFAANFAEEWRNSAVNSVVMRCGARKYAAANAGVCFITSFITAFAGILIFFVICLPFLEIFLPVSANLAGTDKMLIESGFPFSWVIVKCLVYAASCGMWSVFGLLCSGFYPNKYIAVCAPLIASYVFERVTVDLPAAVNLNAVSLCRLGWDNVPVFQIVYCLAVPAALAAAMAVIFVITVKGKIQNGNG